MAGAFTAQGEYPHPGRNRSLACKPQLAYDSHSNQEDRIHAVGRNLALLVCSQRRSSADRAAYTGGNYATATLRQPLDHDSGWDTNGSGEGLLIF